MDRRRCSSIAASKPATSTEAPRSAAISAVSSSGKPKESYSRNAWAPGTTSALPSSPPAFCCERTDHQHKSPSSPMHLTMSQNLSQSLGVCTFATYLGPHRASAKGPYVRLTFDRIASLFATFMLPRTPTEHESWQSWYAGESNKSRANCSRRVCVRHGDRSGCTVTAYQGHAVFIPGESR